MDRVEKYNVEWLGKKIQETEICKIQQHFDNFLKSQNNIFFMNKYIGN